MTRREVLAMAGSAPAWLSPATMSAQTSSFPKMGGAPTAFGRRGRGAGGGRGGPGGRGASDLADAPPAGPAPGRGPGGGGRGAGGFDIVEHCHNIGLFGVQTIPPTDPEAMKAFRQKLESYQMTLICSPRLPQNDAGVAAFEAQVKAYKEAGAIRFHAAMTNRRYEEITSVEMFKQRFEQSQKSIDLARPILDKYKIPLAIENHKGWRSAEQAAWLKRVGSEYVGACLDFGNNMSLCEVPEETLNNLLPYIVFAHIKDMAVQEYEEGFLLSEVQFGDGVIDLKMFVDTLRKKDPQMPIYLEMITRDPLKIPVFNDSYWRSFDDTYSPLPGRDVAKILNLVKTKASEKPLPSMTGLTPEAQLKLEDDYNNECIQWGRKNLNL
jgi:sugar phosphate isomerase/epimerase